MRWAWGGDIPPPSPIQASEEKFTLLLSLSHTRLVVAFSHCCPHAILLKKGGKVGLMINPWPNLNEVGGL